MLMERTEHLSDSVTLHLGDCRDVIPTLGVVDCVVTSPPYDQQRQYGLGQFNWRQTVCGALGRIASHDAQVLVNLGLIHRNGEVNQYWNALLSEMGDRGWRLFGWYVWDQLSGMAGDWSGRLAPSFEFVFHFNKAARTVNKTQISRSFGRKHTGPGIRNSDGVAVLKTHDGKPINELKIPDSVIRTFRETSNGYEAAHPARFPVDFARELIAPFSDPGQTILDPFMGSGTTGVAAVKLGRRFVGIEISPEFFDLSRRRISDALARPDLFVETPARTRPAEPLELPLNSTGRP